MLLVIYQVNTFANNENAIENPLEDTEINRIPFDVRDLIERYKPIKQKCPTVEELKKGAVKHMDSEEFIE